MRVLSCAVLLTTLAFASACGGATSPSSPTGIPEVSSVRMALSGSVRDAQDNAAISGVAVSVISGPDAGRATSTDAAGNFTLGELRVGLFSVRFMREGFMTLDRTISASDNSQIDVQLKRGPSCTTPDAPQNFRVDVTGSTATFLWDPVPGAADYFITMRIPNGRIRTTNSTTTSYVWRGLSPGRYVSHMTARNPCGESKGTPDFVFTIS